MKRTNKKPLYKAPSAVNLSEFTAKGDEKSKPAGQCFAGVSPHYSCDVGSGFVGTCSPGGTPDLSVCAGGGFHTNASCNPGSVAATICISGAGQNF